MKSLFVILLCLFSVKQISAQDFVREVDKKTGKVLLRGSIAFDNILNESSCSWLAKGAAEYHPMQGSIDGLKKMAGDYRFVVFAGTWCGDTKELLPKFYKVLTEAGIDLHAVEMYGVNRKKEALNIEHLLYNIINVPTIIVMYKQHEIGRIVESVSSTIEQELLAIIEKDYSAMEMERMKRFK